MTEETRTRSRFRPAVLVVSLVLFILIFVVWIQMSLSGAETDALAKTKGDLSDILGRPCPNPATVKAWKEYHNSLGKGFEELETYLRGRDSHLDAFFSEFNVKSKNWNRFKIIYAQQVKGLHERAKPVVAKDKSGVPLPASAVFSFENWEISPTEQEAVPAQKKFWIQAEMVDVLLDFAETLKTAKRTLLPELLQIRTEEVVEKGFYDIYPVSVTVRLHPKDVHDFAARVLKSAERRLLVRLTGLGVEKFEHLDEEYVKKVKEGESKTVDKEAFVRNLVRPVSVRLSYEVIDLRAP